MTKTIEKFNIELEVLYSKGSAVTRRHWDAVLRGRGAGASLVGSRKVGGLGEAVGPVSRGEASWLTLSRRAVTWMLGFLDG